MLRLGDTIRLTSGERSDLSGLLGFPFNPQTVAQHDQAVQRLKADYDQVVAEVAPQVNEEGEDESGLAEARLMAAVLSGMLIEG